MTLQYALLAIGRAKNFKGVYGIELYTEDGRLLPVMTDDEAFYRYGCRRISEHWIKDEILHCKLEGVR